MIDDWVARDEGERLRCVVGQDMGRSDERFRDGKLD